MPFSTPWNENDPADTDLASLLGDDIRGFKLQVRERIAVEHFFPITDDATTGYHRQGSARPFYQAAAPTNNPDAPGALWINSTTGAVARDNGATWDVLGIGIPAGVIVMWSGSLVSIPTGWKLCDGSGGTPDLTDKFVRGAPPAVDPGSTGGANTHSHSMGPMTPASAVVTVDVTVPTVNVATDLHNHQDFSDVQDNIPEYFTVAYIMKA